MHMTISPPSAVLLTRADIEKLLPHRPPMLLLDEVLSRTEDTLIARKKFLPDEFFFQGHYPHYPLVPGVIMCEAGMQAGAILLHQFVDDASKVPVATRLNEVKFKRMVTPNETIEIEAKLNERLADAFFLSVKITCEGKLCTRFDFGCTLAAAK